MSSAVSCLSLLGPFRFFFLLVGSVTSVVLNGRGVGTPQLMLQGMALHRHRLLTSLPSSCFGALPAVALGSLLGSLAACFPTSLADEATVGKSMESGLQCAAVRVGPGCRGLQGVAERVLLVAA